MTALITGATGQDGVILSHYLRQDAIEVVALVRPDSDTRQLLRYAPGVHVTACDLADDDALTAIVRDVAPSSIYHLGGVTSPTFSVNNAELTWRVNVGSLIGLLAALEAEDGSSAGATRLVYACSGSIFEGSAESPQNESTLPVPLTPYAKTKAEGLRRIRQARDRGLFASAAVLYNHESPLRGPAFVTKKVAAGVARIASGIQDTLHLGDLGARRDWGWAPDYVMGMLLMTDAPQPADWILATGSAHTVRDMLDAAFTAVGVVDWSGMVTSDPKLIRDVDSTLLVGDSARAQDELGWHTTRSFEETIASMVEYEVALLEDPDALWQIPERRGSK